MGTTITTGNDVVSFLRSQHEQVKDLFENVIAARGEERLRVFHILRRTLAVHETAEEEIVHPAARYALPNGVDVVAARLREENEAKALLTELEELDGDSAEFDARIRALESKVFGHAEAEEREEFEGLGSLLDAARLEGMRKAVELAETIAPTRPHPGIESAAVNLLAGPFAAMVDLSRDVLSGKIFVKS